MHLYFWLFGRQYNESKNTKALKKLILFHANRNLLQVHDDRNIKEDDKEDCKTCFKKVFKCLSFEWSNKRGNEKKCCPIKFEYQIEAWWSFSFIVCCCLTEIEKISCMEFILKVNKNISFTCSLRIKRKKLVISIYSRQTSFNIKIW